MVATDLEQQKLLTNVDYEEPENPTDECPEFVKGERTHWEIFFVTLSIFMGYAILSTFQGKLKDEIGVHGDTDTQIFGQAVSFLSWGNLIFRLAHNFFFACLIPRHRIYISYFGMITSMLILSIGYFVLHYKNLWLVFVAYMLGGMAIGSFESNLLSAITPLGHKTKVWAIIGLPSGFASILVGGFALGAMGVSTVYIYFGVIAFLILSMFIYYYFIPAYDIKGNADSFDVFVKNLKEFRNWAPKIWKHCVALMLDMFFVNLFNGLPLYVFGADKVPLLGPSNYDILIKSGWYFAAYNVFTLLGDSVSRKLVYYFKLRNPFIYLSFSIIGAVLIFHKIGYLAPFGIFFVFFANGTIYSTGSKYIDMHIEPKYNLIALSFWLCIGDVGSVLGSSTLQSIKKLFCPEATLYVCTK